MISRIRQVVIRVTLPLSWRGKSRRIGATMRRFALIEADSCWQFLRAADALPEPAGRARMFLNALEEVHHSALFEDMAKEVDPSARQRPAGRRKALLTDPAELGDFLATIELGEHDVYDEFETYAKASGDARVSELFRALRDDEEEHHESANEMLVDTLGSEEAAEVALKKARWRRVWVAWRGLGADASEAIASVLLGAVFFLAGPFFSRRARARVAPRPLRAPLAQPES